MTKGADFVKITALINAFLLMKKTKIYLDYGATTPVDPEVFEAMRPYFCQEFGNPSSVHQFGETAQKAVVAVRQRVAEFLHCQPKEIIFNSGATEGNNTVIKEVGGNRELAEKLGDKPHIIISQIEHDCVLNAAKRLFKEGVAEVAFLPVNRDGLVELTEVKNAIKANTVLISVMYANNEIGAIQPIAEIGEMLKKINQSRRQKIYFHTDAAQAVNYLDCDTQKLGVDLMTISAHKIYGPKGAGALFVRQGTPLKPLLDGGEQEFRLRAGTHNTPGIIGLGAAIKKVESEKLKVKSLENLRDKLIDGVLEKISHTFLNGSREKRLPNNANFCFEGAEGEAILMALNLEGVAVSTGSACAAKALEPSHVLRAIGLSDLEAHSSLRLTLGRFTTEEEIDKALALLPEIVQKLRNISGNLGEGFSVAKGKLPDDFGC